MRSTGSGSMITPVENGSTCAGVAAEQPRELARRSARARASPSSPVPALALPVLTTSARIGCAGQRRCSLQTITGAAQKRFCVNTPATVAPARVA